MSGALVERPEASAIEAQLVHLAPRFAAVLGKTMQPERLIRTIMISLERTPKLYECNRQSVFTAAMSAACLGLEVDGVTGQAFMLPFKGRAQLVTGYKGYNTLGARASYAIRGAVVRDGDAFEYDVAEGIVHHRPKLGNSGRIVGAWARAVSRSLPAIVSVLSVDELLAVKAKAPGAKTSDSPWNDPFIGFPAMCEKTTKRRLARCMPLNIMQLAAALDEAPEERGLHSWITPDRGVQIEGEHTIAPLKQVAGAIDLSVTEFDELPPELAARAAQFRDYLNSAESTVSLNKRWTGKRSVEMLNAIHAASVRAHEILVDVYDRRHVLLTELEESSQSGDN